MISIIATFSNLILVIWVVEKLVKTYVRQIWMTEEILNLLDQRTYKSRNMMKSMKLYRKINKEIEIAKVIWGSKQSKEIEKYEESYGNFKVHRK